MLLASHINLLAYIAERSILEIAALEHPTVVASRHGGPQHPMPCVADTQVLYVEPRTNTSLRQCVPHIERPRLVLSHVRHEDCRMISHPAVDGALHKRTFGPSQVRDRII